MVALNSPDLRAQRFAPLPSVRFRELGGEGVVLDLERSLYFTLNETGTVAWQGLSAGQTVGEVHCELLTRFEVTPEDLWRDLEALIAALVEERLVSASPSL